MSAIPLILGLTLALISRADSQPDAGLLPEVRHLIPPPATAPAAIRIVSFNVHYARDLPLLIEGIQSLPELRAAGVFLIQEIESYESEGVSRTHKLAQALNLNYVYAPARHTDKGGTHGLAILSRFPIAHVEVLPLKQYKLVVNTRRRIALAATLDVLGQQLRVFNVHLDTRLNSGDRIQQIQSVVEAARQDEKTQGIIGGDFNTNPVRWAFRIVPIFRSNQAKALDNFMEENGFHTPLHDSGSTVNRRLLKFRADSLYTRGLTVKAFGVERSLKVSDHFPVWIEIAWPPDAADGN